MLADQIIASPSGRLHAATSAYTYRQKMQRSFAAELLIPVSINADWYARRIGVAAARKTNEIPAGRPCAEKSIFRPAGMSRFEALDQMLDDDYSGEAQQDVADQFQELNEDVAAA